MPPGPNGRTREAAAAVVSGNGFGHRALFYRDIGEYLSALRSLIPASRDEAEAVLVAVAPDQTELVRRELDGNSADVIVLDMAELGRNPARIIPAFLGYAARNRDRRVCCISEPIWPGRTTAEIHEATRHEALINLAFPDSTVNVLCLYDSARLPESVIADAARTHPAIINDRHETASATYLPPPGLPPRTDMTLFPPPARAESLIYSDDLRMVRSFITSRARSAGLSPPRISDVVIAVCELAGNTLRHTVSNGTVHVWQTGDEIICQVADTGQITDPLAGRRPPSDGLLGGNGLWIVNQVCDLVQTTTGPTGTTTRLHMCLHPPKTPRITALTAPDQ